MGTDKLISKIYMGDENNKAKLIYKDAKCSKGKNVLIISGHSARSLGSVYNQRYSVDGGDTLQSFSANDYCFKQPSSLPSTISSRYYRCYLWWYEGYFYLLDYGWDTNGYFRINQLAKLKDDFSEPQTVLMTYTSQNAFGKFSIDCKSFVARGAMPHGQLILIGKDSLDSTYQKILNIYDMEFYNWMTDYSTLTLSPSSGTTLQTQDYRVIDLIRYINNDNSRYENLLCCVNYDNSNTAATYTSTCFALNMYYHGPITTFDRQVGGNPGIYNDNVNEIYNNFGNYLSSQRCIDYDYIPFVSLSCSNIYEGRYRKPKDYSYYNYSNIYIMKIQETKSTQRLVHSIILPLDKLAQPYFGYIPTSKHYIDYSGAVQLFKLGQKTFILLGQTNLFNEQTSYTLYEIQNDVLVPSDIDLQPYHLAYDYCITNGNLISVGLDRPDFSESYYHYFYKLSKDDNKVIRLETNYGYNEVYSIACNAPFSYYRYGVDDQED